MKQSRHHRLLLLLTLPLVVAIALGYYYLTKTTRQVEAVHSRGGVAILIDGVPPWQWLEQLHYFDRADTFDEIFEVGLGSPPDGIAANYGKHLPFTRLRNPAFDDGDMKDLAPILADLGPLSYFSLSNCKVTDEGLKHLAGLEKVELLYLLELPITDAGLEHVKKIESVEMLIILGTDVTQEALDKYSKETGVKVYQGGGREKEKP